MNSVSVETIASETPTSKIPKIGFAFGGVAGFNAFNAGVLQAMIDYEKEIKPDIITCTSGAIAWVYSYLKYLKNKSTPDLRELLKAQADSESGLNDLTLAAFGLPRVFSPAIAEYISRWWKPWPADAANPFARAFTIPWSNEYWQQPFVTEFFNRLWPAQCFEPTRPPQFFSDIVATFSDPGAPPILFNAYDVEHAQEIVYGNRQALDLINIKRGRVFRNQHTQERSATSYRHNSADVPQTEYREIIKNKDSVQQALWLVWYGLTGQQYIDGAYRRQIILSELTMCDKIYIVKPQPCKISHGDTPTNYFGVQDFQTAMWLNSSYDTEIADLSHHAARHAYKRAAISMGKTPPSPPPPSEPDMIELIPISRDQPLGYFNYFLERLSNFEDAYTKALAAFGGKLPSVQIFKAI